jgi:hypothetical protein
VPFGFARRTFLKALGAAVAVYLGGEKPFAFETEVAMADFGDPFAGLKADRKLTKEELIRAVRFMVSAEYEAVQLYMQLAESTDDKLSQEVLVEIADEERVHAGEFLRLLKHLAPDEEKYYAEGAGEVEEMIKEFGG